jgi:hypothetical protein
VGVNLEVVLSDGAVETWPSSVDDGWLIQPKFEVADDYRLTILLERRSRNDDGTWQTETVITARLYRPESWSRVRMDPAQEPER